MPDLPVAFPGPAAAGRKKICFVATIPFAINVFLRAHIVRLKANYEVTIVSSGTASGLGEWFVGDIAFVPQKIERKISALSDLRALIGLWRLFRRERFDCVHSIMPKSGLLAMIAARLAGVPMRFHSYTGQVWATRRGFSRFLLKSCDWILALNATRVLADSLSQRQFLITNGVVEPEHIEVLADGSIAGVDLERFRYGSSARQRIREACRIRTEAVVFIFLGRLARDKGVLDLVEAFETVARIDSRINLLLIGDDEEGLAEQLGAAERRLGGRLRREGFSSKPEEYLSAADVICLPSYREGFGSVLIEAAAVGLPALASRIYGIMDAVEDGVTGILHKPADPREIAEGISLLATDARLRERMGAAARRRAVERYSEERVTRALADFYLRIFGAAATRGSRKS